MPSPKPNKENSVKAANIFGQPLYVFGMPVERDAIFSNHKGLYNKKVEKRQRGLIVKSSFVKFFLHHDERILFLTTCYSPVGLMEQIITGPFSPLFRRALFIFTDKRILHVPTRFNRQPRAAVSQIFYEDCARLTVKGGALHIEYKNGRQEIFPHLGRKERKKVRALISGLSLSPKDAGQLKNRVHLCPSCANVLAEGAKTCNACKLTFKTDLMAKLRSFLIPGGGYFYARFPVVGALFALADISFMAAIAYYVMQWRHGAPVATAQLAWLACALILTKSIDAYHSAILVAGAAVVPAEKDFVTRKI